MAGAFPVSASGVLSGSTGGQVMPRWPKRKSRADVDEYGRTPLWYGALHGDVGVVRTILSDEADPNHADDAGTTPLHAAIQEGQTAVVRLLLAAGADPNIVDQYGNGPLLTIVAGPATDQQVMLITMLLEAGADPDRRNRAGISPREVAIEIAHGLEVPFARLSENR